VQLLAGDPSRGNVTLTEARSLNKASQESALGVTSDAARTRRNCACREPMRWLRCAMRARSWRRSREHRRGVRTWGQAAYAAALAAAGDAAEAERLAREARATLLASPRAKSVRLGEVDVLLAEVLDRNKPRRRGTDVARRSTGDVSARLRSGSRTDARRCGARGRVRRNQ
jgi:hypothetical protein